MEHLKTHYKTVEVQLMCYVVHPLKSGQDSNLFDFTVGRNETATFRVLLYPLTSASTHPPPDYFFLNQYVKDLLFSFVLQI